MPNLNSFLSCIKLNFSLGEWLVTSLLKTIWEDLYPSLVFSRIQNLSASSLYSRNFTVFHSFIHSFIQKKKKDLFLTLPHYFQIPSNLSVLLLKVYCQKFYNNTATFSSICHWENNFYWVSFTGKTLQVPTSW